MSCLRDEADVAARFGGEEFLVLLPMTDLPTAERIRRAVEDLAIPHEAAPGAQRVTISLGVIAGPVAKHASAELIAAADAALYAAKRNGRNQVWPPFVNVSGGLADLAPRRQSA